MIGLNNLFILYIFFKLLVTIINNEINFSIYKYFRNKNNKKKGELTVKQSKTYAMYKI
jgi:hypothetical protein